MASKDDFLAALDTETGNLGVATVTRDGDSLTVNFRSDVSSSDVLAGAVGLAEALAKIAGPESTLTVGDITITLGSATPEEIIELARLLLGDLTPEQFLASTEPITSAYTAKIHYQNNEDIDLNGSLIFEVTKVASKDDFLAALDTETGNLGVATVTRDGDSLTVNFRSDVSSSDVLAGAVGLAEALAKIAGPESTLTVGDITITLGSATPEEIIELARLLLGDLTPEQFLASTEQITSAYTAKIHYQNNEDIDLNGSLIFEVTKVASKDDFLAALDTETGNLGVATVTRDGDSLTVNFRSDVSSSDVLAGAVGLAEALAKIAGPESTLTVGDITITLGSATPEEIIELARLLLGDLTPEQFLASTEQITSAYTAKIHYQNNEDIDLNGSLIFEVTKVASKDDFLAALDTETGNLGVATVTRDGDSLTVNFRSDVSSSDVLAGAVGLAEALAKIAGPESTLTVGDITITLGSATPEEIIELARLLLGDLTPEQFLASTEQITSAYTAKIHYQNNEDIDLNGSLIFEVTKVASKDDFLAALDTETGNLGVATVTRDGDSLTVNFRSDVSSSDVLAGAVGLAEALAKIAGPESTLTVGDITITLGSATPEEIIELARLLLGDLTPEQFLASTEQITSAYTAKIHYQNNEDIDLNGSLIFEVTKVASKDDFLAALDTETGNLGVATVTRDGDSLTVNFRSDVSSSDVLAGAVGLAEALAKIAGPESTLTVGDITITLGSATPEEIIELARLLLGDLTPEQFLASTEQITSAYTAKIHYQNNEDIDLNGSLIFEVTKVASKDDFLAALDTETGNLGVATVTRDGDSLTVNFRSDVSSSDVLAGAVGLAEALAKIAGPESTLTVGDITITLGSATPEEIIELARLLLGDLTPEQFLASTEQITSAYTAKIHYQNNEDIDLNGSLIFEVTKVASKDDFLAALDTETGNLGVATVTRDGDSLTVNFRSDVSSSDVLAGAVGLAEALAKIAGPESTLTVGDITITLGSATPEEIIELARLLLGDLTPEQFLASTEQITSAYTAKIHYQNNEDIDLNGSLIFEVTKVASKDDFLAALDTETGNLGVATVTRDGDSLTVNFRSDVSSSDVLAGAVGLAEALAKIAGPESTLTVGDITITLGSATPEEIIELARLLLGDLTPEQFLASTEQITSAYTAKIHYQNNEDIDLNGSLIFEVTKVASKDDFLAALDTETGNLGVATVTRDGDSLTVNFRSDVSSSDVLAGAVGLAEALAKIAGPESTLTVGDITITLGSATPEEIIELARLLLGDLTPEQFLASTEQITSAYTAKIHYQNNEDIDLNGSLIFEVTKVASKDDFLAALDTETGNLGVATVTRDGDSLTVNFRSDVSSSDVLAGAVGLAEALAKIAGPESTLTVGDITITLGSATPEEIIELARLLLGDLTPEQFLASTEQITSAYTAKIHYQNNEDIDLNGSLIFEVTKVASKDDFLAALDTETGNLGVATVTRDGDSLTVNFRSDVSSSDVLAGAVGLAEALAKIAGPESTLTVGDITITLGSATPEEIIELARLLLGDLTPEQFLASTEQITSAYTAKIHYQNNEDIDLNGSLIFEVTKVASKDDFLAALDTETGNLGVATVTRDGDSLTVNFRSDVSSSDVLAGAVGLAEALAKIAGPESTLTVGDITITLGSATPEEIIELARLLLGDLTPEQFLASTEQITSAYTAKIHYQNNEDIDLNGSLIFEVTKVASKDDFLAALDTETGNLGVATVTRDGDSLTVNFRSDVSSSDVLAGAVGLAEALAKIAGPESTLTVGDITITLGSATPEEIIELARLLLGDLTPEQFLASTEQITSAYTAKIHYQNNEDIDLNGSLIFEVTKVASKDDFLAALDTETGNLGVATVTRDGDSLTVNFRSDVSSSDVLAGAVGLAEALAKIAGPESTLTVGDITITLGSATPEEIIELARLLLGDLTPEQFLASTEQITSAYTAKIHYQNNEDIDLNGSLIFEVAQK
ncbi:hypothetical protein [Acholeplasma laidlawii]|uniref:hypothetical protein n=1 Tax=Acholeplasma laidlawii TaxID=2148 RepID=UPI0025402E8A|nr:hypothetical protein QOL21_05640 [Acholeplasma laidlawii]